MGDGYVSESCRIAVSESNVSNACCSVKERVRKVSMRIRESRSVVISMIFFAVEGRPKRSTINVQFSDLGFRLLAPGNLSDDQLDEALDSLYDHVVKQEKTSLLQLRAVHRALTEVASVSYKTTSVDSSDKLKGRIRDYFESVDPLEGVSLIDQQMKLTDEEAIVQSVYGLISIYKDNNFTGRAVARIFQGISSPVYPAVVWGRCKFWRRHVNADFNVICKLATREILKFR